MQKQIIYKFFTIGFFVLLAANLFGLYTIYTNPDALYDLTQWPKISSESPVEQNISSTVATTSEPENKFQALVPLVYPNNHWDHMPLIVFIENESIKRFPSFDVNIEMKNARDALGIWETKTGRGVRFVETYNKSGADIVMRWSTATFETPGETLKILGGADLKTRNTSENEFIIHKAEINLTLSQIPCHNTLVPIHELGHALGLGHSEKEIVIEDGFEVYDIMSAGGPCSGVITSDEVKTLIQIYQNIS